MTLMTTEYLPVLVIETFIIHAEINTLKDVTFCKTFAKYAVLFYCLLMI